jgi:hypothetical protein
VFVRQVLPAWSDICNWGRCLIGNCDIQAAWKISFMNETKWYKIWGPGKWTWPFPITFCFPLSTPNYTFRIEPAGGERKSADVERKTVTLSYPYSKNPKIWLWPKGWVQKIFWTLLPNFIGRVLTIVGLNVVLFGEQGIQGLISTNHHNWGNI